MDIVTGGYRVVAQVCYLPAMDQPRLFIHHHHGQAKADRYLVLLTNCPKQLESISVSLVVNVVY